MDILRLEFRPATLDSRLWYDGAEQGAGASQHQVLWRLLHADASEPDPVHIFIGKLTTRLGSLDKIETFPPHKVKLWTHSGN